MLWSNSTIVSFGQSFLRISSRVITPLGWSMSISRMRKGCSWRRVFCPSLCSSPALRSSSKGPKQTTLTVCASRIEPRGQRGANHRNLVLLGQSLANDREITAGALRRLGEYAKICDTSRLLSLARRCKGIAHSGGEVYEVPEVSDCTGLVRGGFVGLGYFRLSPVHIQKPRLSGQHLNHGP